VNWNGWMRQIHRWVSILFAAIVAVIFIVQGAGMKPPLWLYISPVPPLALLALTGLYLFVLPYSIKWRREARS